MALIVIFVFKTPLRKLVILGLDRVKRGRGPIVVKTIAGTVVFVVMFSTIYNVISIRNRWIEDVGGDLFDPVHNEDIFILVDVANGPNYLSAQFWGFLPRVLDHPPKLRIGYLFSAELNWDVLIAVI
nr:B-cell receptor-associated protein 31-like [Ipomoea batatas]